MNQWFRILVILVGILISINNELKAQFSTKILNESFNSNAMRWDIKNDEFSEMLIQLGKYTILNKTEGTAITSTIESPHLQYDGFRIQAKLSKIKGIENNGFGLVWGSADASNEFEFVISANGYFKIVKWEQGQKTDLIDWTYQSSINKWDFNMNELRIESDGAFYRYYINDNYVALTPYIRPYGNRIGFVINENIELEVDEIVIENVSKNIFSENKISDFQNVTIGEIWFSSSKSGNTLYYNDTATISVEINKPANILVKDLMLMVQTEPGETSIQFNSLHMLELDNSSLSKQISFQVIPDENIKSQSIMLAFQLKTPENEIIDTKKINIQLLGINSYVKENNEYKPDYQINTQNQNSVPNNQSYQNTAGCAKSCVWSGLISVLIGVILTIL